MNEVADAHDAELFPRLTDAWIRQIREAGAREETVPAGTILFDEGDPMLDFFVVLAGALDILQGTGTLVVRHRPRGFVGDTHALAGRLSVVRCVAAEDSRVLRLPVAGLRRLVVASGARYRRLPLANAQRFEGQGIYYAATAMEDALCRGQAVVVVGDSTKRVATAVGEGVGAVAYLHRALADLA